MFALRPASNIGLVYFSPSTRRKVTSEAVGERKKDPKHTNNNRKTRVRAAAWRWFSGVFPPVSGLLGG